MPFFLNFLLHEATGRLGRAKDPSAIVSHHYLIKLIVSRELALSQLI